jgi:hypothetical protein
MRLSVSPATALRLRMLGRNSANAGEIASQETPPWVSRSEHVLSESKYETRKASVIADAGRGEDPAAEIVTSRKSG